MMEVNEVVSILKEEGEYHEEDTYLAYGNVVNPKHILVFESLFFFQAIVGDIRKLEYSHHRDLLFICSYGIPSQSLLDQLKKLMPSRVSYFGDMDPTSFFAYITLVYLSRTPNPKDKKKLLVNYGGLRTDDYAKFLGKKEVLIKMKEDEKKVLSFVEQFGLQDEIGKEIDFIKKKNAKVETPALTTHALDEYRKHVFTFCPFECE